MNKGIRIILTIVVAGMLIGLAFEVDRIWWAKQDWDVLLFTQGLIAGIGFFLVVGVFILASILSLFSPEWVVKLHKQMTIPNWTAWLIALPLFIFPAWFMLYNPWGSVFTGFYPRIILFLTISGLLGVLFHRNGIRSIWESVSLGIVLIGCTFILGLEFQSVTDHPFSLTWSEGNRIYDYSILYGRRLYDYPADQALTAYIDRGRQALWGLPFLLPKVTIWGVRFWDAVVKTVPYVLFGWVVFRDKRKPIGLWMILGLWTMSFLYQGPIYTPLVLSAILVAGGLSGPVWIGLPLVALAGYYAQASRFTWLFAPAFWSGMVILNKAQLINGKLMRRDWIQSIAYGIAGVVGGYILPLLVPIPGLTRIQTTTLSAEGVQARATAQPLLWERLWPNPTYGPGIVLGLLIATGPLILYIILRGIEGTWAKNIWQKLTAFLPLLAFLSVGLVASVKIGGGSNLHNLDMFLIGIIFIASSVQDTEVIFKTGELKQKNRMHNIVVLLIVAIPAFQPMLSPTPLELPDDNQIQETLALIQVEVDQALRLGDVLFMDQRQLLTFGYIENLPLIAEYEKKLVIDRAFDSNEEYFQTFYEDIAAQRFSLILTEPIKIQSMGDEFSFGQENDTWVEWVSEPLLCYYEPIYTIKENNIQLLIPKKDPVDNGCP